MSNLTVIHFIKRQDLEWLYAIFPQERWIDIAAAHACTAVELRQIENFQEIRNGNFT